MEASPAIGSAAGLAYVALLIFTVVAVRRRPVIGIGLLVVLDPFGVARHLWHTDITLTKIVVIGMIAGLLLRREGLATLTTPPVRWLLAAAGGVVFATVLTAIPGEYIDVVARESLKSVEYLAIFAVAAIAYRADPDDKIVWGSLVVCVASVSLLALVQERSVAPSVAVVGGHVLNRIAGPLEGPNQLAGFYDVAVPMVLAFFLRRKGAIAGGIVAAAALTDILTLSRAGVLGLATATAAVVLRSGIAVGRAVLLAGGALVALVAGVLAQRGALQRFASLQEVDTGTGLGTRSQLWTAALQFFVKHPLLGIGAGNFELELPTLGVLGVRTHANSLYLQSLAEGGIVLFAATVAVIVVAVRTLYLAKPANPYTLGAGAATLALAAHQVFDDVTFFPKVGGFWWLWLGIAAGSTLAKRPPPEARP